MLAAQVLRINVDKPVGTVVTELTGWIFRENQPFQSRSVQAGALVSENPGSIFIRLLRCFDGGAEGTGDVEAETAKSTQAACGTVTFDARDTGLSLNKQPSAPGSYAIPTIASVGAKGAGGLEQYDNGTAPTAGSDGFVTVRVVG